MTNIIIKPGDKIDIKHLHQNNQNTYMSSVFDILEDGKIEVSIPTFEGKMMLFPNGTEFQFYFHSEKSIYTCEAVVLNRFKRGNFLLFLVELRGALKKVQRREFYRLECLIDFAYYQITDEIAELEQTEEILNEIGKPEYYSEQRLARTKDISGGGIRFMASEPLSVGTKILTVLPLSNNKVNRKFYLVTEVISCEIADNVPDRWVLRGRFEYKNKRERDMIVQYVFEEDRMIRKKENG